MCIDFAVQFFVQGGVERPTQAAGTTGPPTFPLFTEAVKFASHGEVSPRHVVLGWYVMQRGGRCKACLLAGPFESHEPCPQSMVRAAVRTLALMVFRLRDPAVERFLLGPAGVQYAISLGTTLQDRVQVLDRALWRAYAKGKLQGECLCARSCQSKSVCVCVCLFGASWGTESAP